jgi:DNA-binding CsgD family transcriptional regulator
MLMAQGHIAKTAGQELGITESTVKNLLWIARMRLGAKTTTQAVAVYLSPQVTSA